MKTLQLSGLAMLCCLGLAMPSFAQNATSERGSITLKDNLGHEVKLIPQKTAPNGSWTFEIPYLPMGAGGSQTPQANPGTEPYITFQTGSSSLSNNRVLATGSGISLTVGGSDNNNATLANTGVLSNVAGSGISLSGSTGNVTITNSGVLSITGTANQVNASASTGAVTLSLPQNIHSGASPTFTNANLTAIPAASTFTNIVVSNGGALQTRTIASLAKADGNEPLLTFSAGGASMTNNRVLSPGFGIAFTDVGSDNGAFTIENSGVLSAIGTANQVNVSAATGNVTFSLPQNIHNAATPTFSAMTLSSLPASSAATEIVVSNAGVLETRSVTSLAKSDGSEPIVTFGGGGASLTNNRVLTAGTGIAITDGGGDNGTLTISATSMGWNLTGNNFAAGDFLGGEAGNTNALDLRTDNTTRLMLNNNASIQRDAAGDARGDFSTDMQPYRSSNDQVASGMLATIGGGGDNRASGFLGATIGGGVGNVASGFMYSTVSGGSSNTASGFQYSTVGGGNANRAQHNFATVAGGKSNNASGAGSFIGGGGYDGSSTAGNQAGGPASTIAGGYRNDASIDFATIGGGSTNLSSGYAATIAGGESNQALDYGTAVGGGIQNYAAEFLTTVSGGGGNTASQEIATVGGGLSNTASGFVSTIGGGQLNNAGGDSTTIAGGSYNTATGRNSTVGGGSSNTALSMYATVGGGLGNLASGGSYATVSGGDRNIANAQYATVVGGRVNTASHESSFVGGGQSNSGANSGATVVGGFSNMADGIQASVVGGGNNRASGGSSSVGGGHFNTASGAFATVPGGTENVASAERSTAMGFRAHANRYNQVSHAGGHFSAAGDAQGSLAVMRNTTSGTTSAELFLDGTAARFSMANNTALAFSILVVGKSADGESAGYEFRGIIERVSFTTSIIGAVTKTVLGEDDAAWDVTVSADNANGSLRIDATGNTSDEIRWVATVRTSEVTY